MIKKTQKIQKNFNLSKISDTILASSPMVSATTLTFSNVCLKWLPEAHINRNLQPSAIIFQADHFLYQVLDCLTRYIMVHYTPQAHLAHEHHPSQPT